MAIRRVRIYKGEEDKSLVIGFSAGALDAPDDSRFGEFMKARGYAWDYTTERPGGSVSYRHVEIRPPFSDNHLREFGALCVGGVLDGRAIHGIVDPYHDGVLVLDNRRMLPDAPLGGGVVIARY